MWERADRWVEEVSTEIENQGARNDTLSRPDCAPGRPPGRPVEEAGRLCTNVHRKEAVDRPVDRLKVGLLSVGGGRPARSTVAWVGRPTGAFDFPFRIRIPFLDGIESNLGFLKFRDSVAIKKRLEPSCIVSLKGSLKFPSCISCIDCWIKLPRGRRDVPEPR